MRKISKVDACILATRAMLSGDYKKEQKINNIIMNAMLKEKKVGQSSKDIILNENEQKVFA